MNSEKFLSIESSGEKESLFSRVIGLIVEGFNLKKAATEGRTLFGTILNKEGVKLFNEGGDAKLSVGKQMADTYGFSKMPDFTQKLQEANEKLSKDYYDKIIINEKPSKEITEKWVPLDLQPLVPGAEVDIAELSSNITTLASSPAAKQETSRIAA